jgi:hypothetical protein
MRTEKDVEAYLSQMNRRYRVVEGTAKTFLVEAGADLPPVAVRVVPPLVVVRVRVGEMTGAAEQGGLYKQLLELNARQLVHASYGIDDSSVVLSSALEIENLDFNELQAVLDEIDVALATKLPGLKA